MEGQHLTQAGCPDIRHNGGGEIPHGQNGQHDLVGGKGQKKCQQHHAVQTHEIPQGLEKTGQDGQQRPAGNGEVGQQPQHCPGGHGHRYRPTQDKERPVQQGAHQNLPDLRQAIGGQLQGKGGHLPPQEGAGEELGGEQRHAHGKEDHGQKQPRPQQPPAGAAGISQEKQGDQRHQCGEAAVAGDQGIGQLGREPLPGGVDNAAAGDSAGVAAEAHAHGQALPPVTAAAAHKAV